MIPDGLADLIKGRTFLYGHMWAAFCLHVIVFQAPIRKEGRLHLKRLKISSSDRLLEGTRAESQPMTRPF